MDPAAGRGLVSDVSRETDRGPAVRLMRVCATHAIPVSALTAGALVAFLDRLALEPQNLTAIDGAASGVDRHLADSLVALTVEAVRRSRRLCDLGSGGGFPGIPLAMLLPECAVTLVESERTKADWLARATAGSPNVCVVADRSETLARDTRESWDVVTARALGAMPVVMELAAPLLSVGGTLVAWRGETVAGENEAAAAAGRELGLTHGASIAVTPFPGARRRIELWTKSTPTPARFPRRPGRAAKRPLA